MLNSSHNYRLVKQSLNSIGNRKRNKANGVSYSFVESFFNSSSKHLTMKIRHSMSKRNFYMLEKWYQ